MNGNQLEMQMLNFNSEQAVLELIKVSNLDLDVIENRR